ncbi:MAG: PRD domain-containing protein [Hespellia sp.]|jgi:transcriptional antiterminator|nr:PRD domain-containing protein [Hespellia sp.]
MYRVTKVLNHNAVIAVWQEDNREYLIMGKGVGFGKKVSERMDSGPEDTIYSLQESTERGDARDMVKSLSPECLEIADEVLGRAEEVFGKIDRNILFPMADHIEYAVRRIQRKEQISNPLTDDIRILFHTEYKVAECIGPILKERMQIQIDPDEIGYVALHIHSAIMDEKVSQSMLIAQSVRECISLVEQGTGSSIDVMSLAYNRLMNHVRYMIARAVSGEKLKLNMNDYMSVKFPKAFQIAESVCDQIGHRLKCALDEVEIGYLAMHIERVADEDLGC